MAKRIAIIGAGIAGISSAWYLQQQGHAVSVIDRHDQVAYGCSHANGGQLSVCNAMSWHHWRLLLKALQSLFADSAVISLGKLWDVDKLRWLLGFVGIMLSNQQQAISTELVRLSIENQLLLAQLQQQLSLSFAYRQQGIVKVFDDLNALQRNYQQLQRWQAMGLKLRCLSPTELVALEPSGDWSRVVGGIYATEDATGDIAQFCQQLMQKIETRGGEFVAGVNVTNLIRLMGKGRKWQLHGIGQQGAFTQDYDAVVVAAGAHTPSLLRDFRRSFKSAIYPVSGYSITINLQQLPEKQRPRLAVLDEHYKIATSRLGDAYRVAGFACWQGLQVSSDNQRIEQLKAWFCQQFPHTPVVDYYSWACMRPMTPSMLPEIKSVAHGLYVNSAAAHLGWTTGLACAKRLAALVV